MSIFVDIKSPKTTQVDDKFRISAKDSFVSKDEAAVSLVQIRPSDSDNFIDVTGSDSDDWYLDWAYTTDGAKNISVRITTDGSPVTETKSVTVLSEGDDKLFSTDEQLVLIEPDILKYIPQGRNSWKNIHRLAQSEILEWLYTNGYLKTNGKRLTKDEVINVDEVSYWSRYIVLRYIFRSLSNAIDDIYAQKAELYENWEHHWRHKSVLKLDWNGDGEQGDYESRNLTSVGLSRRWD